MVISQRMGIWKCPISTYFLYIYAFYLDKKAAHAVIQYSTNKIFISIYRNKYTIYILNKILQAENMS